MLIDFGRALAVYGVLMIMLGVFFLPESWQEFLSDKTARFGIALAGVAAILIGFVLATIGGI